MADGETRCGTRPRGRPSGGWRRTRPIRVVLTIAGATLAATACGNDAATPARSSTTPATATGSVPGTPTTSPPSDRPASSPSTAPPARCTGGHLGLSLGRVSPAAGNRYAPVVFTNTGEEPCSLRGYPGVTLLDASGERIGESATRQGPTAPAVTLDPGGSAYAALHTVARGVTDKPCWKPATRLQAYPPGSTWALRTPADSFRVCGDVFEVSAVKPGSHP
ncbi:DUF4232 domain-containing protein [Streptomyces sp. NPDC048385]|uniref:DUF4232 domain-containing protein n=1 Tax=unclassified Streptomyces TaxID=2593676 RepID=UPI00343CBF49